MIYKLFLGRVGNNQYERVVVEHVKNDDPTKVFCNFVDSGHSGTICAMNLVECPETITFEAMEPQVCELHLHNIAPIDWQPKIGAKGIECVSLPSKTWSPAAVKEVQEMLRSNLFIKCKAEVQRSDNNILFGDLFYFCDGVYHSLSNHLISKQLATKLNKNAPLMPLNSNIIKSTSVSRTVKSKPTGSKVPADNFILLGSKPFPRSLNSESATAKSFANAIRTVYDPTYQPKNYQFALWSAVDNFRNLFVTMPDEMVKFDENCCSAVIPALWESSKEGNFQNSGQLKAIYLVPSGPIGSKLFQQLNGKNALGKVKFLFSGSDDNDCQSCNILIVTPIKLEVLLRVNALKIDFLTFIGFLHIDEQLKNEADELALSKFRHEVARYKQLLKTAKLFGLTKTWSPKVLSFYNEWFAKESPLNYFFDPVEAAVYRSTKFDFVSVANQTIPRQLNEITSMLLSGNDNRTAVCCPTEYFPLVKSILREHAINCIDLEYQLAGDRALLENRMTEWASNAKKQILLIPDAILNPEIGLNILGNPNVLIHVGNLPSKHLLKQRFKVLQSSIEQGDAGLKCFFIVDKMDQPVENFVSDLLARNGIDIRSKMARSNNPQTSRKTYELCNLFLENGICPNSSACVNRHHFDKTLDDISAHSTYATTERLIDGGRSTFKVLNVISGNHFSGIMRHPHDYTATFDRISSLLKLEKREKVNEPMVNRLYGVSLDNGLVYRRCLLVKDCGVSDAHFYSKTAVLKENKSSSSLRTFLVRFVDFGNCEKEVDQRFLFDLKNEELKKLPWLSIDFILCNIRSADQAWPKTIIQKLKDQLLGKEIECSVAFSLRRHVFVTNMLNREVCSSIGNERATVVDVKTLLSNPSLNAHGGIANPNHLANLAAICLKAEVSVPQSLQSHLKTAPPIIESFAEDVNSKQMCSNERIGLSLTVGSDSTFSCDLVRISAVHSPDLFFVQRMDSLDNLEKLDKSIEQWVEQCERDGNYFTSLQSFRPKMICLARLPIDSGLKYSRVEIRGINRAKNQVDLFSIDHGELEREIDLSDLLPINLHLSTYPAFAIECHLVHVAPFAQSNHNAPVFDEEASQQLWDLGFAKNGASSTFFCKVIEKKKIGYHCKHGRYFVELWPCLDNEDAIPAHAHTLLSASSQLIRLVFALPQWDLLKKELEGIKFSSFEMASFVVKTLVPMIDSNDDDIADECNKFINTNFQTIQNLVATDVDSWLKLVDVISRTMDIGDSTLICDLGVFLFELIQNQTLQETMKIDKRIEICLQDLLRRIVIVTTYLLQINDGDIDTGATSVLGDILVTLILISTNPVDQFIADIRTQTLIRSGLIATLIKHLTNQAVPLDASLVRVFSTLIEDPVFAKWLRRVRFNFSLI